MITYMNMNMDMNLNDLKELWNFVAEWIVKHISYKYVIWWARFNLGLLNYIHSYVYNYNLPWLLYFLITILID